MPTTSRRTFQHKSPEPDGTGDGFGSWLRPLTSYRIATGPSRRQRARQDGGRPLPAPSPPEPLVRVEQCDILAATFGRASRLVIDRVDAMICNALCMAAPTEERLLVCAGRRLAVGAVDLRCHRIQAQLARPPRDRALWP